MIFKTPPRVFFIRFVKSLFFKTPFWRYFLPIMKFDMTFAQLNFMLETISEITSDGIIFEVGVGGGSTSVVLNNSNMLTENPRPFYALDTFYGFVEEDIKFENEKRGKNDNYLYYRSNSKEWYTKTLFAHGVKNAHIFQCDAKLFDYDAIPGIAFCLLDIDLYSPTKDVLPKIYNNLVPGGVIVVDDCSALVTIYDGAGHAYREFCKEINHNEELVFEKLGVIRKPL